MTLHHSVICSVLCDDVSPFCSLLFLVMTFHHSVVCSVLCDAEQTTEWWNVITKNRTNYRMVKRHHKEQNKLQNGEASSQRTEQTTEWWNVIAKNRTNYRLVKLHHKEQNILFCFSIVMKYKQSVMSSFFCSEVSESFYLFLVLKHHQFVIIFLFFVLFFKLSPIHISVVIFPFADICIGDNLKNNTKNRNIITNWWCFSTRKR
jgi:alkylated DNA nucleotide flippase Atl1